MAADPGDTTPETLAVAAAAASHRSWNAECALGVGGEVSRRNGGLVAYGPDPRNGGWISVMFVERPDQHPAETAEEVIARLAVLRSIRSVGWWAATTRENLALGTALMAQGFQWGWRPHWMWHDLDWPRRIFALPDGVHMARFPDDDGNERLPAPVRAFGEHRRPVTDVCGNSTTVLTAFEAQEVVGTATLHVSVPDDRTDRGGSAPLAGLFDCWVVPRAQRRGIGAALVAAALDHAAALGCALVTLNATEQGQLLYRHVGFRSAGWGQTWCLVEKQLRGDRPDAAERRLVEAIGGSDADEIDAAIRDLDTRGRGLDLEARLACSETPLGVAVRLQQPASARRLVDHGAHLDLVSAWDLGWRAEAEEMLRRLPGAVDERIGDAGRTPLMIAIERDDEALAQLILESGPDLSLRDREFDSDALGWAEHYGRARLALAIRSAADRRHR